MKQHQISLFLLLLTTSLAQTAEAGPEFLEDYKRGVSAIDSERWGHAVESMNQAIRGRDDEAKRLPRYLYLKPYIPHFYRGLALFKLGDCPRALAAWKTSEHQGVVTGLSQYEQIELARQICRSKATRAAPPSTAPPPRQERPYSPPREQESSRARSTDTSPNSYSIETSPRPSMDLQNVAPATEDPWRPDPRHPVDFAPVQPSGPPPESLLEAAQACFAGNYRETLDRLASDGPQDPYSQAHGHLLAAAAEVGLYLEGGEQEAGRLEAARRHVLETRRLLPDLEPPERFFSPRFLDFYYGQRPEEQR